MLDKIKNVFKKKEPVKGEPNSRTLLEQEKEAATKAKKPWVGVSDTQVNPDDIKNGFFELDWNNEFIEQLLDAGYKGESNEQIVDAWFQSLIRQMLTEEGQDPTTAAGYINVVPIDKGKSEVS